MKHPKIGIRIEDKSASERRAPLTPDDMKVLIDEQNFEFVVQPSPSRTFKEKEYEDAGARIDTDISDCDLIVGIKEVPEESLVSGKPHFFFSHTIKGQSYNMPLLQKILDEKVTVIDYEKINNDKGMRLIAFSVQAGQAGMINTLWSLGQRYAAKGFKTSLSGLKQANSYPNGLDDAIIGIAKAGDEIRKVGLPSEIAPLVICITGGPGRVSSGAQDVISAIKPIEIDLETLTDDTKYSALKNNEVYFVVMDVQHFVANKDGNKDFDFKDYIDHPENYKSVFDKYIDRFSAIVNGIYWEEQFPKLVTVEMVKELFANGKTPKLTVIGDVTCDVEGSIECNLEATYPENPVYVYGPKNGSKTYGFEGHGLQMMTVDILPTEIPQVSSKHFSNLLKPFIAEAANRDFAKPFEELELSSPLKGAIIAHNGKLAPDYEYLYEFLK